MLWALALGTPIAVLAALRPASPFDYAARLFSSDGFALQNLFVATQFVYYVSVKLGLLPTSGWTDGWKPKILPSFTLGLVPMVYTVRPLRASLLETLEQDYVLMARAKGLGPGRVIAAHALRNSIIPLVTVRGPLLGYLISGSFVIENIFALPGVARFYVASVLARDYTVVMGSRSSWR